MADAKRSSSPLGSAALVAAGSPCGTDPMWRPAQHEGANAKLHLGGNCEVSAASGRAVCYPGPQNGNSG
jgi:hypothetical protein